MTYKTLYLISFCSLTVLIVISLLVSNGRINHFDRFMEEELAQIYNPTIGWLMKLVSLVLNPSVLVTVSTISMIVLFRHRNGKSALILIIGVGGSSLLSYLLKHIFARIRPIESLTWVIGYSFPSGHATTNAAFFLLLIYFLKNRFSSKLARIIFIIISIFLFILVGFSRIYLNLHWTSDVIGGFALGLFWASFVILTGRLIF